MATAVPEDHKLAIKRFEGYAAQDADNIHVLVNLGDLYHRAARYDEALATYLRVVELEPNNLIAQSRIAGVQLSQHNFAEAEATLSLILDSGVAEPALQHNLGLALFYQDRYEEAFNALESAAAATSDLPRSFALRAHALHHMGEAQRALEFAEIWAQQESTTEAHGYLALLNMDLGNFDQARDRAAAVLDADPNNADAGVVIGTQFLEQQDMERAADLFKRLLIEHPSNPRLWLGLGLIYLYQQQFAQAIEAVERALVLMPDNGGARVTLGWAHLLNRDLNSAERVFTDAVKVNRNFSEAHGGHAAVLALRGRHEQARLAVRRAQGLDPACFGAVFAQSIMLEQQGKSETANRLVQKALEKEFRPGAPTLIDAVQTYARREAARGASGQPKPLLPDIIDL